MEKERSGPLHWVQQRVPIEHILLALLICLIILEEDDDYAPQSSTSSHHSHSHSTTAQIMQCDARAGALQLLTPAFCPAAAAVTSLRKLELASADYLDWDEAKELLTYLPFVLFRFPEHKGAGLLAILASHFTNGGKAPTPKDTLAVPTTDNTTSTTSATPTHLAVKNRFARSFSQLVASQLVPGDLITVVRPILELVPHFEEEDVVAPIPHRSLEILS